MSEFEKARDERRDELDLDWPDDANFMAWTDWAYEWCFTHLADGLAYKINTKLNDKTKTLESKLEKALERYKKLDNMVNMVTCQHRHGQKVSEENLTNLCNRQYDLDSEEIRGEDVNR